MTAADHIERLVVCYSKLGEMNHENLAYRIKFEALGKSSPDALAAKLIAVREGKAQPDAKAPEDEAIWVAAMQKLAPGPITSKADAK